MTKLGITKATKEDLQQAIDNANTFTEVLLAFGLENKGGNFKTIHNAAAKHGISLDGLKQRSQENQKIVSPANKRSNEEMFIENSAPNINVRGRVIKDKLLPYECANCGIIEWQGKPLSLQLDHINGINTDNRLENLRFLCPNCHSQTETWGAKKLKSKNPINKRLGEKTCECGAAIYRNSTYCKQCGHLARRKAQRPSREELLLLVRDNGYEAVGRMYGVSGNAVKKWLNKS